MHCKNLGISILKRWGIIERFESLEKRRRWDGSRKGIRTEECEMIYLQFYMLIFCKDREDELGAGESFGYNGGRDCRFLELSSKVIIISEVCVSAEGAESRFWHAELQGPDGVSTQKYAAGHRSAKWSPPAIQGAQMGLGTPTWRRIPMQHAEGRLR